MLLQTIKSRNLWLWGEIITSSLEISSEKELTEQIEKLNEEIAKIESEDISGRDYYELSTVEADRDKRLSQKYAERNELENRRTQLQKEHAAQVNVSYKHRYTTPFKITALQSVDVTWDNPVGESYGLTANFLQSWHNKPVNITFKGISYMGAFGGDTVGKLSSPDNASISNKDVTSVGYQVNHIATNISKGLTSVSQSISNFSNNTNVSGIRSDATIDGKYDVVIDTDVENINRLLSNYGEGLYPQQDKNGSPYIYLLIENPGSGYNNQGSSKSTGFVTYIGHIKNFTYSERVDKPFLYDYTVQFVGEPTLENAIRQAGIEAKQDASSVKLTVTTSDSGFSLGYGW